MTERFQAWWRLRSVREQRLLLVMAGLFLVVFLWIGIIGPIADARAGAWARHEEAVATLGRVRADAAALRAIARRPAAPLDAPLATVVSNAASAAGFASAGVSAQGTARVTVSIASARPGALFPLIADLERRGILVERIAVRANADQTLGADMTLIGRGIR